MTSTSRDETGPQTERWLHLDGAVNVRDVGGLPLRGGGRTRARRLLRADNLQALSRPDVQTLRDVVGVRDVVDLRTSSERTIEGPGPLDDEPGIRIQHLSLLPEAGDEVREVDGDLLMPWQQPGPDAVPAPRMASRSVYVSYLQDRPHSLVAALQTVAHSDGAVVVHCAAGKDRTGVVVALALDLAGAEREAILDDYLLTAERLDAILHRLSNSRAYASNLRERSRESHLPRAQAIQDVLDAVDGAGGAERWLSGHGWQPDDSAALRARLTSPDD
ncbi:MAG: tyrosine-protein phosphatase [Nocardioidaceae bacterium]